MEDEAYGSTYKNLLHDEGELLETLTVKRLTHRNLTLRS